MRSLTNKQVFKALLLAGGASTFAFAAPEMAQDEEAGEEDRIVVTGSRIQTPGNFESTLATIEAAEGHPIHLAHVQFHSYGKEGARRFSSAASQITEAVNHRRNVTVDVGDNLVPKLVSHIHVRIRIGEGLNGIVLQLETTGLRVLVVVGVGVVCCV